jgi:hypothetical protein
LPAVSARNLREAGKHSGFSFFVNFRPQRAPPS